MSGILGALLLLLIGMITVFTILSIVVLSGKLLIHFVNRWEKESTKSPTSSDVIDHEVIAAISAAVNSVTTKNIKSLKIDKK